MSLEARKAKLLLSQSQKVLSILAKNYQFVILLLMNRPVTLILQEATNNLPNEKQFQIFDKLIKLAYFIRKNSANTMVYCLHPIDSPDDGKVSFTIKT